METLRRDLFPQRIYFFSCFIPKPQDFFFAVAEIYIFIQFGLRSSDYFPQTGTGNSQKLGGHFGKCAHSANGVAKELILRESLNYAARQRSEERRVGRGWRSRWAARRG